ncbi:MAG: hypothetical protein MUD08_13430 [Cytophagales bacterium]|jgi:hypothetical protein|nr:hypothetical protein [Cytophagales bacterium]
MLEYAKTILEKVSFDRRLFEKELSKALINLVKEEVQVLRAWCYEKFGQVYAVVLDRCFSRLQASI